VIATHNRSKAGEMLTILSEGLPWLKIQTLADYEGAPEPEETGSTYEENAGIKSEAACLHLNLPCIADDAGIEIDALEGKPGVYSKRFLGESTDFKFKNRKVLEMLKDVSDENRGARYYCAVCLSIPNQSTQTFVATCYGKIALEPSGSGGFGYDPIFYLPELGCTMADLTAAEKHTVSHRGRVLAKVIDYLSALH